MCYIYLKVPTTLPSYMIICKLNFSPFWTIYSAFRCTKVRVTGARDGIRIRVWRCEWRKGRRGHYKIPLCPTRFFFFILSLFSPTPPHRLRRRRRRFLCFRSVGFHRTPFRVTKTISPSSAACARVWVRILHRNAPGASVENFLRHWRVINLTLIDLKRQN